jgi:hypothetical protein
MWRFRRLIATLYCQREEGAAGCGDGGVRRGRRDVEIEVVGATGIASRVRSEGFG